MAALIALLQMATQNGRATDLDGGHNAGDPFCGALGVVGYRALLLSVSQRLVQIEQTLGRADLGSGKAQIVGRRSEATMTKKNLNGTHVSTGFQQVNGKGVLAIKIS
jgi:hypothetical protein